MNISITISSGRSGTGGRRAWAGSWACRRAWAGWWSWACRRAWTRWWSWGWRRSIGTRTASPSCPSWGPGSGMTCTAQVEQQNANEQHCQNCASLHYEICRLEDYWVLKINWISDFDWQWVISEEWVAVTIIEWSLQWLHRFFFLYTCKLHQTTQLFFKEAWALGGGSSQMQANICDCTLNQLG